MDETPENIPVTIAGFHSAFEAHMLRSKLEANGITCYIRNEHMHQLYQNALGSIFLMVRSQDVDKAKEILSDVITDDEEE